jgi:hypothetical protein
MIWTELHDEMLCREIIGVDVFSGTKKGTLKRSAKWTQVVENLTNVEGVHFKVDNRAVRDRYHLLSTNLRRKLKREEKESGIAPEMSEVEKALEALIEKEDAAEELRQEGKSRKVTIEADRMNAEDIRKKAMENLGETQKRKSVESGVTPAKKKRSNGSDTVNYLREKHEKMLEVEKKKLTMEEKRMEAASKRHDKLMTTLQQQQQQQTETFQVMMMQQQRQMQMQQAQQNELMLKLFGMLNNK